MNKLCTHLLEPDVLLCDDQWPSVCCDVHNYIQGTCDCKKLCGKSRFTSRVLSTVVKNRWHNGFHLQRIFLFYEYLWHYTWRPYFTVHLKLWLQTANWSSKQCIPVWLTGIAIATTNVSKVSLFTIPSLGNICPLVVNHRRGWQSTCWLTW